jgi:hypothetical protein
MAPWPRWLLPAATGVIGIAAGFLLGQGREVPAARGPAAAEASTPVTALTAEDLRRVVREELAARGPEPVSLAAAGDPQPVVAPEVMARESAAASQAQGVLDAALARRTWTEQDADGMREVFASLSGEQQAEFLRQYAVAVNQGRLVPQTERVPF